MPLARLRNIDLDALYYIDNEAADILHSAVLAAQRILTQRDKMDVSGNDLSPLYVLAGESHYNPCEYLHHVLVLEYLKQSGARIACGVEVEHNFYENDSYDPTPEKGKDRYFYESADFAKDCYGGGGANYGRKVMFSYLARQKKAKAITPVFNDAACNPFDELIMDEYVVNAYRALSLKTDKVICATEPCGVSVRNRVMLDIVNEAAQSRKLNIIFQIAGLYHIGGGGGARATTSLSAMLDKSKAEHLSIYTEPKPKGAYDAKYGEDIMAVNVPCYEATGKSALREIINQETGEYIRIAEREREFVDLKLDALGFADLKVR